MGTDNPLAWAREKRHRLRAYASGEVAEWTRKARDVCLPGVPLAAIYGFFANGKLDSNTTGWIVGDDAERAEALARNRKPLGGDPTKGYGHVGGDDLHELGPGGVEGNRCPAPVATGTCPWVSLATSAEVVEVLGRPGVTGAAWYGAIPDQVVIGVANLRRHLHAIRARLDPRLQWPEDKPLGLWAWFAAMSSWSAGSGGTERHFERYTDALAPHVEGARVGAFLRLAASVDDPGRKHRQDEYTALRGAQKLEGARLAVQWTGEGDAARAWLDDGLGDDRERVYAALVGAS